MFPQTLLRKNSKNIAQKAKEQKTIHTAYQKTEVWIFCKQVP